jgi:ferric-dicitrate binding protein FerR (iron transport regulator)
MKKDEQKEQLIETFLTKKPVFDPEEIDVPEARRKVFKQIDAANPVRRFMICFQRVAAVLIIPLILLAVYRFAGDFSGAGTETFLEVTVPCGMFSHVELPDGSQVWLNGGSSLKYPTVFRAGRRNVVLDGEGYFEVRPDRKNPFTVRTAQLLLTATGTAFNVEAWPADSVTSVTMTDGKVDVAFGCTAPFPMKTGERAICNSRTGKSSVSVTDASKWCAWKDGMMIFRDDPLSYVFERLERTFNADICIKSPEIASDLYRATFEDESLDEILNLLEKTAPIRFVRHKREKNGNRYTKKKIDVYKHNKQ